MTKRTRYCLAAALALVLEASPVSAATSTNNGSWYDGKIWDSWSAPTNTGDSATVLTSVSLPYSAAIPSISLSALTIGGGGALNVTSPELLTTAAGALQSGYFSGRITVTASLTLAGTNNSISGSYVTNAGIIQILDTNQETISSSHLEILPGAQCQFLTDCLTVNGYIDNWGTVRKSGGSGVAWLNNTTLNDYAGTVRVDSGWLVLGGGTTLSNTAFIVGPGAGVDVTGSTRGNGYGNTWSGQIGGSGSGQVQLNAGTVGAGSALTLNFPSNVFSWTGGSLSGNPLTNAGVINLSSTNGATLSTTLYNRGLIWHSNSGAWSLSGGHLVNLAAGTYDLAGDFGYSGGTVDNYGLVRKNGGTGVSSLASALNTFGGVAQVDGGWLVINGGGTQSNATFTVAAAAELDLSSSLIWSGAMTGGGGGKVVLNGGGLTCIAGGAALNFPTNCFWWTGGIISGSAGTNLNVMQLNPTNGPILSGTFYNAGILKHTGSGSLYMTGAHLENLPGATIELANDGGTINGYIDNWSLVRKSAGSGISLLNNTTLNTYGGTVEVDSGRLVISGGSSNYNATLSVAANAVLDVTGGYSGNTWSGQVTGNGAGTVLLASGAILPGASLAYNFPSNLFWWTGGTLYGNTATNAGTITIWPTNNPSLSGTFYNGGLMLQTGAGTLSVSGRLKNLPGATYSFAGDGTLSGGYLDNSGLIRKSGGSGTSTLGSTFSNSSGVVEVDSGSVAIGGGLTSTNSTYNQLAATALTLGWGNSLGDTFNVGSGAALALSPSLSATTINAASGAQVSLQTGYSGTNGTFNVSGSGVVEVTTASAKVYWTGSLTGSGSGQVLLRAGEIYGQPSFTLNFPGNLFLFAGGRLNGPTGGAITNLGVINVLTTNTPTTYQNLYNYGLIRQTGTNSLFITSSTYPIENMAGGTYELAGDNGITGGAGNGLVDNWGLLLKSAGTGTSKIAATFANHGGSVRVDSGTLSVPGQIFTQGGGTLSVTIGGTNAGQWGQLLCDGVVLGGPLNVVVSNGIALNPGSFFMIVSSTNRIGTFSSTNVPAGLTVAYTPTGVYLSVSGATSPKLQAPQVSGGMFGFSFPTSVGQSYMVLHNDNLATTNWVIDTNWIGNGSVTPVSLPATNAAKRFYRVRSP
jgi:hypothetical protein